MIETNQLLRHILSINSTNSVIDLDNTIDQEIREYIKDGFLLSLVVLIFLYILKLMYLSMALFNVLTASDDSETKTYPGGCSLCCDIISCVLIIVVISFGIYALFRPELAPISGVIYLTSIGGSFVNNFITLITVCNTEHHNEYTISYGLISMAIVIIESLSLNVGSFHMYYAFLQWKRDNPDKEIDFWPFPSP